jgi:hypothetical protein
MAKSGCSGNGQIKCCFTSSERNMVSAGVMDDYNFKEDLDAIFNGVW